MLTEKESDIERLKQLLSEASHEALSEADRQSEFFVSQSDPNEPVSDTGRSGGGLTQSVRHKSRRGKAPPVDPFTGEEQ